MKQKAEKAADKMAEKVAKPNEVYVRRQCRNCSIITGGFSSSEFSERRTCRAKVNDSEDMCGGDMDEIFRGRV